MAADVAVFDPATVIDHATYEDAGHLSEGIRFVVVNGRIALRDGKVTGEQGGTVLLRDAHMKSSSSTMVRRMGLRPLPPGITSATCISGTQDWQRRGIAVCAKAQGHFSFFWMRMTGCCPTHWRQGSGS